MSEPTPIDVHAPYVQELAADRDWAGLVRYWMAHQHKAALDAAIVLVEGQAALAAFLNAVREEPLDPAREPPEELFASLAPPEQMTLYLVLLYPRLALCEMAGQFPLDQQDRLYRIGLESGERACQVAQTLEDRALHAFSRNVMAGGFQEVNDLEAARDSYQEALGIRRELARVRPDVFRSQVAMTLNNLGNVQRALNDLEAARDSYQEANTLYTADAVQRPTARLVERQRGWNNLGRLYLHESEPLGWPDRHQARDAFRKARDCAEAFRGRFRDIAQRRRVQGEALHVYESLVNVNAGSLLRLR
ncbi:MAG TPA: tetratricopeptide repeat protein [Gemmata sp.]